MTLLGLDFDNTLVDYDDLFHKLAVEKELIEHSVPANKQLIRDYLREQGKNEEFTLMQGEVYGKRILEAKPMTGMTDALWKLKQKRIEMVLISHKTKIPYKGPRYDLRAAARSWLLKYKFYNDNFLGWKEEQIHFEDTKEEKIERIKNLGCNAYIDDLNEILARLPTTMIRIHYNKKSQNTGTNTGIQTMGAWSEAERYL